ncbi:MAG: glycosyl hydrolase [Saprospiraceae bacterium]
MQQKISCALICLMIAISAFAQTDLELEKGFENPPADAKARTWWHWMNGNVTKQGITADLEAMKKVGIQEAQLFNVKLGLPEGQLRYLSSEWLAHFKYAAEEAKRLGLELAFHNGAGWSSSGGPWITPEYAMQTVVYSEKILEGGTLFKGSIPQPETRLDYYKDIAVLAFPKTKSELRIDGLDYKKLDGRVRTHLEPDTKMIPKAAIINQSTIIDLSSKLTEDGFLEWKVPAGEWVILRLGHTPTGHKNRPAPEGGSGLECDKMSKKAVDVYWQGGIEPIIDALGDLIGSVVNNCIIDSYEVGTTNWTAGFDAEFKRLRGYDCRSFLPTLAGYYVDGGEVTERFLWDFRRTVGDLIAENYYAYFRDRCHAHGMKFSVEPYWGPFDNMQVGATGDIVMCEFWSGGFPFFDSPKFVSSIAHLNGSSIVGAESFTGIGGWAQHPATIKSIGDRAWAQGITRFIFHTYVHQPWDVGPGLALSYHGLDFNRLNTWWSQGEAFLDYVGRSQFLLQQGQNVADVLVFTGESSPNNALLMPEIKTMGYDYDLIGVNKLESLEVEDGMIRTSVGGKYRVLFLPKTDWARPETLQKLEELAKAGATIIGAKPQKSPSLKGYPACDQQVSILAKQLWDNNLIKTGSVLDFLKGGTVPPDFLVEKGNSADISFMHRKTAKADIYFIANSQKTSRTDVYQFRVTGKQPELWNAETGEIKELALWKDNGDGTTSIPVQLASEEAVFIVFKKPVNSLEHLVESSSTLKKPKPQALPELEIIKAEYGSFLQEGLVDITDIVSDRVKDGQLDIIANRGLCDCDPAMGYNKEFRMEYKLGDVVEQIYVMEREPVNIVADQGELKILKAVFGKFKPENRGVPKYYPTFDITEKIKALLVEGKLNIPVDDRLIDGKSAPGNQEALRITFSTNGEERTLSIPKGQQLNLAKDIPASELVLKDGKINWITPYPGELSYSTSSKKKKTVQVQSVPEPIVLSGPWAVNFPNGKNIQMQDLVSWSTNPDEDIRYFSGTATYEKEFIITEELLGPDYALEMDLGNVQVIAELTLNGEDLGILWKAPFRLSLDGFVKEGLNKLEIKVTNLWPNRLIGDEQMPKDFESKGKTIKTWPDWLLDQQPRLSERLTFASYQHYWKDSELLSSGLLGPVIIRPSVVKVLEAK